MLVEEKLMVVWKLYHQMNKKRLADSSKFKHVGQTALLMQMEALQKSYTKFVTKLPLKNHKDLWYGHKIYSK